MSSLEVVLARAVEGKGISLVPGSDDGRGTGLEIQPEEPSTALVPWQVFSLDRLVDGPDAAKQLPPSAPVSATLPFGSKIDGITVAKCICSRKLASSKKVNTFEWKLNCRTSKPLHISVCIEKSRMSPPCLRVVQNGSCVFPKGWNGDTNSIRKPGKLLKDYAESWSMWGAVRGLRVERAIEMCFRSGHGLFSEGKEKWLVGTLVGQNARSEFDVLVEMRDHDGVFREKLHSQVRRSDLRYADTKEPLEFYEHKISLLVPQMSHWNSLDDVCFTIDGKKHCLHLLARQSPAHNAEESPHIIIQVPKHSGVVTANASLATLSNHSSRQARAISSDSETSGFGSRLWVIQIGHAQHRISVSRKAKTQEVTLEVDGDVLLEASRDELTSCHGDTWECSFRFFGERCLDFYLLHTNTAGHHVAEPHIVPQRNGFMHTCKVSIQDVSDIRCSDLCIDGVNFGSLPRFEEDRCQSNVHTNLSLLALTSECNIIVPTVVSQFPTLIPRDEAMSELGTIQEVVSELGTIPSPRPRGVIELGTLPSPRESVAGFSDVEATLSKKSSVDGSSEAGASGSKRRSWKLSYDLPKSPGANKKGTSEAGSHLSLRSPRGISEVRSVGAPSYAEQLLMRIFTCSDSKAHAELGGFESLLTFSKHIGLTASMQHVPDMQDMKDLQDMQDAPRMVAIEEGRFVREGIGISRMLEANASLSEPRGTPLATNVAEYLQGKYDNLSFDYEALSVDV